MLYPVIAISVVLIALLACAWLFVDMLKTDKEYDGSQIGGE